MNKKVVVNFVHFMIFVLHILLLLWIIFVLKNGGRMPIEHALFHFLGMAIFGALLIRGCALIINKLTIHNYYPKS